MVKFYSTLFLSLYLFLLSGVEDSAAQSVSKYIVADQFGYLPDEVKIAVVRDPETGFDGSESFTPGNLYAVVNSAGEQVYSGPLQLWSGGAVDASSGDKAWWFDFSSVNTPGEYYILDVNNNVRSYPFQISAAIYNDILKHAVRTFFYQRAGFAKEAKYAGAGWADGASHMQDKTARPYNDKTNASKAKDVFGGWYDAGDYNKYTNWTSSYVVQMMLAYLEKPDAWADNYNLPESGNGVPDLLDEAKWGIDHLLRMQQADGSVISIASLSHASPPSSATGTTYYGGINTSSAHSVAAAFAIASKVYRSLNRTVYADTLIKRAKMAWDWSGANPNVIWRNNDDAYGSKDIGAGQQEQDDYSRLMGRLKAAVFLFDATGEAVYKSYVDANYKNAHLFTYNNFAYPFEGELQDVLLYYTSLSGATSATKTGIINAYKIGMNGADNFSAYTSKTDPYRAHLKDYTWGSNNIKSMQGTMFHNVITYNVDATKNTTAREAALGYVHYIHGVNPLSMVYLSNMYNYGAEKGVNEFYHTWFTDKSAKWDRVGTSTYGPAPGFLTGGVNPGYDWDGCCSAGTCGSSQNNAICTSESITPPKGQPKQKSYKDFNTNWPLNSWAVTENSNGYQISYIRLLSKFVDLSETTSVDSPVGNNVSSMNIFPNPTNGSFWISNVKPGKYQVTVMDIRGSVLKTFNMDNGQQEIQLPELPSGSYLIKVAGGDQVVVKPLIKL
ncbi:MAG: glycoside hydrolase family 9 protein [Sporocytophaga sp.]|uniref:glycoside hydrolase family 9 protein n=1 Tax=Sporocytophaga sp. TaxID=2231183 RepID=UPI001B1065A2|nr:glycoside hydrolase family 9 protein [Sporocytophaga sp.]MBO9699063.1 glycoside hydrolase family 9 protein [Sporocytophaga sp.]